MYKANVIVWNEYLETNRHSDSPLKLNRILKRRMRTFIKARQIKVHEESNS